MKHAFFRTENVYWVKFDRDGLGCAKQWHPHCANCVWRRVRLPLGMGPLAIAALTLAVSRVMEWHSIVPWALIRGVTYFGRASGVF